MVLSLNPGCPLPLDLFAGYPKTNSRLRGLQLELALFSWDLLKRLNDSEV